MHYLNFIFRDGQLRVDDQITHINGRALKEMSHNEGVKLLQSARGMVELVVMRDSTHSHAPPLTNTSSLHHHKLSPDPPATTGGHGGASQMVNLVCIIIIFPMPKYCG